MFIRREFHPFNFRSKFDELIINFCRSKLYFFDCQFVLFAATFSAFGFAGHVVCRFVHEFTCLFFQHPRELSFFCFCVLVVNY